MSPRRTPPNLATHSPSLRLRRYWTSHRSLSTAQALFRLFLLVAERWNFADRVVETYVVPSLRSSFLPPGKTVRLPFLLTPPSCNPTTAMASIIQVPNETKSSSSRHTKDGREIRYCLQVIQQPERARACGSGAKCEPRDVLRTHGIISLTLRSVCRPSPRRSSAHCRVACL